MLSLKGVRPKIWLFRWLFVVALTGCAAQHPWRSLPERTLPFDQAWALIEESAKARFPKFIVIEPEKGYLQSDWRLEQIGLLIGTPVSRTRLILWVPNRSPIRIFLKVEREEYSLLLGRWLDKTSADDPVLLEIAQDVNSKLQRF